MVTCNKETLVTHNLLDKRFFDEILNKSHILTSYNLNFYKIDESLEFFSEDLFYIFYKHIVHINKEHNIHSFLLSKILDSTEYKKITLRTKGSTFETYLVLKFFSDQIFIRLKGTNHIKDISSYFENLQLHYDELSSIKNEIRNALDKEVDSNNNRSNVNKINEIKILKKLVESKLENTNSDKLLITASIQKSMINNLSALIDNVMENSFPTTYSDILECILEEIETKSYTENIYNRERNNTKIADKGSQSDEKELSNLSDKKSLDKDETDIIDDLKEKVIEKLENLMKDDEVDANEFVESLIMQIEELSIVEGDASHEAGEFNSDSQNDTKESSSDGDNYSESDSSNSMLNNVSNSKFENPQLSDAEGDVDQKQIINGSSEDKIPIFEEIIDTIEFVKHSQTNSRNDNKPKYIKDIFKDVIKKLELLQGKIIKNQESITKISRTINLDKDMNTVLKKLEDTKKSVKTLGISAHSLSSLNMDEVIELEKRLRSSDFKRFVDKIGKKKLIASHAKKKKTLSKDHIIDKITFSDDMDNIIEDEILQFALDINEFEWDFYDRLLNKAVLSNQFVSIHGRNKGPIILCYDGSGSMEGAKIEETKAHIIAILDIAKCQKRKVILIQFASKKEDLYTKEVDPSHISTADIYEIYDTFIKGGTDFEKPLKKAMQLLKKENYREGDILFITDGHCEISQKFISEFNLSKHIRKFKLYSIIIHGHTYSDYGDLARVSDEVLEIKKSNMNDWNKKISEKIFSII